MKRRIAAMLLAVTPCLVGGYQTGLYPASAQSHTPSSSPGPLGSISGRVFVDVDANGSFGGPDVPLRFPLQLFGVNGGVPQPPFVGQNSADDGTYQFTDLAPGNYQIAIEVAVAAGCVAPAAPFTWVGDTFTGISWPTVHLTTPLREISVAAGENATGIDFPEVPPSYDVTARVWADGRPLSGPDTVLITVGGHTCWNAQVAPVLTLAEIIVSYYRATLSPFNDPACQRGDLDILINGRSAGATTNWDAFWAQSLFSLGPRPLNQPADTFPYLRSVDLAVPSFLSIAGQVTEAGTVTPENPSARRVLVRDGTEIRAFVGATLCGVTVTKTLTGSGGQFGGNAFGLIVPASSVKAGCGTSGAQVTFCVGDSKARQPAAGPFSNFPSPETKPVVWSAPALTDVTLEPTDEPCLAEEATPEFPVSLPQTGGPPQ